MICIEYEKTSFPNIISPMTLFICTTQKPLLGQGLLIIETSRSHSDTQHCVVGLLWTSDRPVAETST